MDIRNWPIDRILQLPDHLLSRRYSIFVTVQSAGVVPLWDISELAFPDRAIIHEFSIMGTFGFGLTAQMRLALGDQLPTTVVQMDGLEPLFAGLGIQGADPRQTPISTPSHFSLRRLKMYVAAQGRRLVIETTSTAETGPAIVVGVVVSAIPTEVPDCLVSV